MATLLLVASEEGNKMNCPHCGKEINVGALLGARSSAAKTRAARENAKKGGWPKGRKRGKRVARRQNVKDEAPSLSEVDPPSTCSGLIRVAEKPVK